MKTLYDLLGALPNDDAEQLRAAFRRAARANHPDRNPDDPGALLRFRQIVHANAILADPRQRATYDRLLQIALRQQAPKSRRAILSQRARRVASDVLAAGLVSAVSIAGYVAIQSGLAPAHVPAKAVEIPEAAQPQAAAPVLLQPSHTAGQTAPRERHDDVAAANDTAPSKTPGTTVEAEAGSSAVVASIPENIGSTVGANLSSPAPPRIKDAAYYRERAIEAYQSGDLQIALVDFDLAISLAPDFVENYVDRSIVFFRLGDQKRAFADIAEAKRIENARGAQGPGR